MENIIYAPQFVDFLKDIKSPVAEKLLSLHRKVDVNFTLIDVDLSKEDIITFVPAPKLKGNLEWTFNGDWSAEYVCVLHTAIEKGKSNVNPSSVKAPSTGTIGKVVRIFSLDEVLELYPDSKEAIYRIFRECGELYQFEWREKKRFGHIVYQSMFGSNALAPMFKKISKNEMKVGRLAKRILDKVNSEISDKEIEDFVNKFKSLVEVANNAFSRIKIVQGEDIRKYYHTNNYISGGGTLNSSCMKNESTQSFLDIYVKNPEVVSLVIFKARNGDDKICGRAILWEDSKGRKIMDRIYTAKDSDEQTFKEFAIKEGFYYKQYQDYNHNQLMFNGERLTEEDDKAIIHLNSTDYDFYPYVDTMKFLNKENKTIQSYPEDKCKFILNSTSGIPNRYNSLFY